jgi:hypothetical protein
MTVQQIHNLASAAWLAGGQRVKKALCKSPTRLISDKKQPAWLHAEVDIMLFAGFLVQKLSPACTEQGTECSYGTAACSRYHTSSHAVWG